MHLEAVRVWTTTEPSPCLNGPDLGPPVNCVPKERPKLLPRAAPELVGCGSGGGQGKGGEGVLSIEG